MKQNHKTFLTRKRWIGLIVLILATIFTAIYACKTNIDPAPATIAGSFGSIAALLLISYILKVRDDLFFCGLLFVYFASPVGSVLNLYRSVDLYDSRTLLQWSSAGKPGGNDHVRAPKACRSDHKKNKGIPAC